MFTCCPFILKLLKNLWPSLYFDLSMFTFYKFINRNYSLGNMNCDDLDTLRAVVIAMMIFYFIITVTSFISSIFGCLGTCCAPVVSISDLQNSLLATEIGLKTL